MVAFISFLYITLYVYHLAHEYFHSQRVLLIFGFWHPNGSDREAALIEMNRKFQWIGYIVSPLLLLLKWLLVSGVIYSGLFLFNQNIITHRLHVLKSFCDRIYILENGTIINYGNHGQLLKTKNLYSNYWNDLVT